MTAFPNWMISVDDHVLEPGDLWQSRVPAKLRERAPRLVSTDAGTVWEFDGERYPTSALAAAVAPGGAVNPAPLDYSELGEGCWDPKVRVADMDRNHVLASLCFPSFPRFAGQLFSLVDDRELGLACIRAYNDWMIDEWSGGAPGRLMSLVILPYWDQQLAVDEIHRTAAKGATAVAFSENPGKLGFPSIHDAGYYWDPVFAAAEEAELPVCMHMGSSSVLPQTSPDAPWVITFSLAPTSAMFCLMDWLYSGQFIRHPSLKVCLSEGGIGWIPFILQRASWVLDRNREWIEGDTAIDKSAGWVENQMPGAKPEPIDVPFEQLFRDHVYGCFIDDPIGMANIDAIGADNIMLETDYPHVDSTFPDSWASAKRQLAGQSDETIYKIVQGNARRVFHRFEFADLGD
jgi:predicted TIM-barrel fold metal-dependent hydrolase